MPQSESGFSTPQSRGPVVSDPAPLEFDEDDRAHSEQEFRALFATIDDDNSGEVDTSELCAFFQTLDIKISQEEIQHILGTAGSIAEDAFVELMFKVKSEQMSGLTGKKIRYWDDTPMSTALSDGTSTYSATRHRIWELFDQPSSSILARVISFTIMFFILVSTVAFVAETELSLHQRHESFFGIVEIGSVSVFTLELVLRLYACPERRKFFNQVLNVVDVLAILPFFLELALGSLTSVKITSIRIVRLVRVFRLFKFSRYLSTLRVFDATLRSSASPLAMITFVFAITVIVFSSLMYYLERGTWNGEEYIAQSGISSPFNSIPGAFWWCIITMTTIGYGDEVPETDAGKLLAGITSMSGVLLLSIPIAVISSSFRLEHLKTSKATAVVLEAQDKPKTKDLKYELMYFSSSLELARSGRQRFLGSLKQLELSSRSDLSDDLINLISDTRKRNRS